MEEVTVNNGMEDGYEERIVGILNGAFDVSQYKLVPENEVVVPWKCDFHIPVMVEIPE